MLKEKQLMSHKHPHVAIVGASGAVGLEVINILANRHHPQCQLSFYGSQRSEGSRIQYQDSLIKVEHVDQIIRSDHDFAVLCADAETAIRVRTNLSERIGAIIDNSSAFRMDPAVPLVIPEVNGHLLGRDTKVIANPNCSTIMLLTALNPLREALGIRNIIVTTYQAVSGAGKAGIRELYNQTRAYLNEDSLSPQIFPCSCAFNVFEHESDIIQATGFNGEESKIINETHRIWQDPTLSVLPTCVRVPVERSHSQAVVVEFDEPATLEQIRKVLDRDGIHLVSEGNQLTPRDAANNDDVYIGRIRLDPGSAGRRALLWICADQLRKGAALNAIQIMDKLVQVQLSKNSTESYSELAKNKTNSTHQICT